MEEHITELTTTNIENTMYRTRTLCLVALLGILGTAQSQTIYKTVDEEGNIAYTSVKPEANAPAEIIEPPREPSPEEIQAAQQRQKELQDSIDEIRERRKEKQLEQTLESVAKQKNSRVSTEQQVIPVPLLREPTVPRPRTLPTVKPPVTPF